MLLIDTSVWVEFFRGNPPPGLRELLTDQLPEVATTEPIVMEVLAGATDDRAVRQLETLVNGLVLLPVDAARDYHDAAAIYRAARFFGYRPMGPPTRPSSPRDSSPVRGV